MFDAKLQYFTDDDTQTRVYRFKDYNPQIWDVDLHCWVPYAPLGKIYFDEIWVSPITPEQAVEILEAHVPCTHKEALAILASDVPSDSKHSFLNKLYPWDN